MKDDLGRYHVRDIEFVAASDVDEEKVGKHRSEAVWSGPNNTVELREVRHPGVRAERGTSHDGTGEHLSAPPNSAGIVIDAARCCRLPYETSLSGSPEGPGAHLLKSPARRSTDHDAWRLTEEFITTYGRGSGHAEPTENSAAATQD
jgi:myo-inositol-1-phosphate synthase